MVEHLQAPAALSLTAWGNAPLQCDAACACAEAQCWQVGMQEDKAAMIAGVKAVNTSRADLGIVVDTDVDRSAVVAGNGTPINSNRYIALMSYITLRWSLARGRRSHGYEPMVLEGLSLSARAAFGHPGCLNVVLNPLRHPQKNGHS